ncbi:hypothetical protein AR687_19865 [Flavobacteriaceae bacterium CRH]|nr:hypothetical protein AR687_19865 [Flavobacteriaceae bacterium CRH]
MSKTTICGGNIIHTSNGKTTFEVTNGDFTSYAGNCNILEAEEEIIHHDYVVSEPEKEDVDEFKTGVSIIAAIFFDGTKNNKNNTEQRLKNSTIFKQMDEIDSSYDNYFSNVAIMQKMSLKDVKKRIVSKYIEGEGTEDNQKGDTQGYGFGSGKTGIPTKVAKGTIGIVTEINKVFNDKEYVKELNVDIFGFSRGAAAARSFMTTQKKVLQKKYPKSKITYRFVGLFDTVSSYEPEGNFSALGSALSHNFDNDVEELKLQLNGMANKIVHLTAADEYRENFALTNIDSSILAGVGYELELPGAHSDIGGGYEETEHIEKRYINKNSSPTKIQWIEQGWYREAQIVGQSGKNDPINFDGIRKLTNSYQFIPLSIMMELAKKYGVLFLSFDSEVGFKKFKVIPKLENIKNALQEYALANDGAVKKTARLQPFDQLKFLRNNYLHISANKGAMGMGARFEKLKLKRKIHPA